MIRRPNEAAMTAGTESIRSQLLFSVAILGVAGIAFWLIVHFGSQTAPQDDDAPTVPAVLVEPVSEHNDGLWIAADGFVVPFREVTVSSQVAGRIAVKSDQCRAGKFVRADDVLVEVDARDYELEVSRLEKERAQATVMISELEDELAGTAALVELSDEEVALRLRELNRQRGLANVVSASEVELAEWNHITARNAKRKLENQLKLLSTRRGRLESAQQLVESMLEKARLDESRTRIASPTQGVVVSDQVEVGGYVQKGTVLFTVEDTSRVEVACRLRMEDLHWMWNAQADDDDDPADVGQLYALPQVEVEVTYELTGATRRVFRWSGRLDRYDGFGLDEKTRTVPCRVVVDNPRQTEPGGPPALIRGMYVSVRIHVVPQTRLLRIPEAALRPGDRLWLVSDDRLRIVPVDLVEIVDSAGGDRDAIVYSADSEAVAAGDQVIVTPLSFASSGMAVDSRPSERAMGQ